MKITEKLKERFCKDCNIPIRIFREPYFEDRILLYDSQYHTIEKWSTFIKELEKYENEQEYFEEYNRIKDTAINDIKKSDGYNRFINHDMNEFRVKHNDLPSKDVYKPSNVGRKFISIDMKQANFNALKYYSEDIFDNAATWEEFISKYTDNKHIITSKYIRQVILGNCCARRQVTYEKYLMSQVLIYLLDHNMIIKDDVEVFSNDEIVIGVHDKTSKLHNNLSIVIKQFNFPLSIVEYILCDISGTAGYCQERILEPGGADIVLKCANTYNLPFILRYLNKQDVTECDKVFMQEGKLAKFIETPKIEVNLSGKNRIKNQSSG